MTLKKTFLFCFFLIIHFNSFSQIWNKQYDNGGNEYSNSITILNNAIFISEINETNSSILKLDLEGNIIASKKFDNILRSSKILKTSTNELLYLCTSKTLEENIVIIKLDQNLNTIWSIQLELSGYQFPEAGIENSNGDFTICGFTATSASSTGTRDGLVFRINSSGQILWFKKHSINTSDYFSGIAEGPSGNMVLVGAVQGGAGLIDISVSHMDKDGNIFESYTWGGTQNDGGYSVVFNNNAYYVSGNTWSAGVGMQDMVLLKMDVSLNLVYAKTYGGADIEPGLYVSKTSNGKIILAGQTTSVPGKERDICILLLEDNGDIISMKNIGTPKVEEVGYGYQFIEEYNGNFYVTSSTITPSNNKNSMLSKIDMITNDTCCNIVNNLNFTSLTSNIPLLIFGLTSSSNFVSSNFNLTTSQSNYTTDVICKPDTTLKTDISANAILFCKGSPIQFSAISNISNVSYRWNFGDPSSGSADTTSQQNPIHIFTDEGQYIVNLISYGDCSVDTDKINITILGISNLNPKINNIDSVYCLSDSVSFAGSANLTDATFRWEFGDPSSGSENTSFLINPKHKFSSTGFYKVYFIVQNVCGSDTDSVSLRIADIIIFNSKINTTRFIYCENEVINFTILNLRNDVKYTWDFGDPSSGSNNTSNSQNPSHIYTSQGLYRVILTTENKCNTEYDTLLLSILDKITINSSINTNSSIYCLNENIDFNAVSADINATYEWDFGDPSSGINNYSTLKNPTHQFSNAGSYLITLNSKNECNSEIDTVRIRITPSSKSDFNFNIDSCIGIINLYNTSENINLNKYYWTINDTLISESIDTLYKFNTEGNYILKLIANPNSNCSDTTIKQINYKRIQFDENLIIPNTFTPNNDGINDVYEILNNSKCYLKKIKVFNRYGRELYESDKIFTWDGKINGELCPAGNYIVYIEFENKTYTKIINLMY